jgi:hypothetical protein
MPVVCIEAQGRFMRSIPHFESQVRPCVPGFTGLNSFPVLAASQTNTAGYIFATPRAVSDVPTWLRSL